MFIKTIDFGDDLITIDCFDIKGRKMTIALDGTRIVLKSKDGLYIPEVVSDTPNTRTFRLEEK